ncbi:RsmB/NOP family class I SAM-dependent RNA methyltransferase [Novosphingobium album (ex Liu et al. 2023)]|uniref:RsmB/NOP family class I SAM-dependent RNA methyltransferase n=1 Tax=Novosphingobium album (ex Liu et al. 2023) TaxID=3031130 RepID=A0ABT5WRS6_9SPHN|nr:RsmB/NOP family class I SAM-dependent RNA methyltransferase [Novosphingobium album (ex Liu et al. 2023)]MDE8652749.1 RsmB/NOP family class I SAM-dependent RNA methyltransferase [Novosphingobium album (ex Liu et al. 2023)]
MTPAARVQAAIEVLDLVIAAARDNGPPADRIVADWFRTRRFAGSGDRRAVRELVFRAIRACGDVPQSGRAAMLRLANDDSALAALFDGSRHAPAPIAPDEPAAPGGTAPAWLAEALAASGVTGADAAALLERAPLDIRVNALKAGIATLPEGGARTAAPHGWRYPHGTRIEDSPAFRDGMIEVQDTGSQLACMAVGARPGESVIDLCAGAGGKTLALAAETGPSGTILACDTDRGRLARLEPRTARAGAPGIATRLLDPGREAEALADWRDRADAVLVDAPCSGTGTWRRNPEARWRLNPAQLARYTGLQARLLDIGAALVRPGGRLVFVTCSLLDAEGAEQAAAFLSRWPGFRAEPPVLPAGTPRGAGIRLSPAHDGTDGFFIARLVRV